MMLDHGAALAARHGALRPYTAGYAITSSEHDVTRYEINLREGLNHVYFVEPDTSKWLCQYTDYLYVGPEGQVNAYFLCRHRDCLYTCRSVDWLSTDGEGGCHFYCPMCTRVYEPFVERWWLVPTNKVCFFKHLDGFPYLNGGAVIRASGDDLPDLDQYYYLRPYVWDLSEESQSIEHTWKVRQLGVDHPHIFGKPPWERLDCARQVFQGYCAHPLFEHHLPTKEIMKAMRKRNAMSGYKEPHGCLDLVRFEEKGSYGKFMKPWLSIIESPFIESSVQTTWMTYNLYERAIHGLGDPMLVSDDDSTSMAAGTNESDNGISEWSDSGVSDYHEC
jgi:hypothetical protein